MSDPSIQDRIQSDMTTAMKAKDAHTLSTLRMLKSALMEARTKKPKDAEFTADEEIEILMRYAKKRRETIDELKKAGRGDLVAREEEEIAVTQRYLPQAISEDELKSLIRATIEKVNAAGLKDSGKVIGAVLAQVKGRADGGAVSRLVREALGA